MAASIQTRSRLYLLLAAPFEFPDPRTAGTFTAADWGEQVQANLAALDIGGEARPPRLDDDFDDFQTEFIGLFEVGLGGAPCPLHSGYYARDRMRALEEVVRFYRFFDFKADHTPDRLPDHLTFELRFMAHLIEGEGEEPAELRSLRLAQRDFVERHLVGWIPRLHGSIESKAANSFLKDVSRLMEEFIGREHIFLQQQTQREVENA